MLRYIQRDVPLSFEQALALGRGGGGIGGSRTLPSPLPNGHKPRTIRRDDSDEDDWC